MNKTTIASHSYGFQRCWRLTTDHAPQRRNPVIPTLW